MLKKLAIVSACAVFLWSCGERDAQTVIGDAKAALGNVNSITYSGTAKDVAFQQCGANETDMQCRGTHDPMRPITEYTRVIDVETPMSRQTGKTMNIGAGGSTSVSPGTFLQEITTEEADVAQPWPGSAEYYLTPWGFLEGAEENNATVSQQEMDGKMYTVLSWSPAVKAPSGANYVINGYLNDDNLIERVETWLPDNIMGDMHVVADYSDYQDFGGAEVPTKIVETRGGWPFFEVDVEDAEANPADLNAIIPAPAPKGKGKGKGKGGPQEITVEAEKLGDGVWRLTTGPGSYDSVIVEFDDHIMMLEAGQSQARASAYVAKAKELIPNKPITYVFNTHPHSDHTGGLPVLVAEGATIVTSENNAEFFERALNTPRTLMDPAVDVLAAHPMEAKVETIPENGMKIYTDGNQTVELYHVWPVPHSNGLSIAYLPKEKVLFQGDFSVNPGQPANDHVNAVVPVIEDLGIDYDRYINVHASAAPQHRSDVMAAYRARQAGGAPE